MKGMQIIFYLGTSNECNGYYMVSSQGYGDQTMYDKIIFTQSMGHVVFTQKTKYLEGIMGEE